MAERFVYSTGTISVATGASVVTGTGTAWGGRDRAGSQVIAMPADAAAFLVGIVAEVDPRGIYEDLELPLVAPYNGDALTGVAYVIVDGPAIANGATQAAIYARFAAHLEQNMGLAGNDADAIDYALVPNNSLIVHDATKRLKQWRNGVLEDVANGVDGATVILQDDEPDTDYPAGSIWIDSDSADLDVYHLTGSPLAWVDTGKNLKGLPGIDGTDGASDLTTVRIVDLTGADPTTAYEAGDTLDGKVLATNDIVLRAKPIADAANGVYVVPASGAASRHPAFTAYDDHCGRFFGVKDGTSKGKLFGGTSAPGGTLGTTAIPIPEFTSGGGSGTVARNRIINPSGMIAQAGLASTADGAYTGFDQWLALTQSNPVTPSALTNVEDGTPYMMRITQANASAQRFGLIQWIESANCIDLRGQSVFLTARVRMSASTTLRVAVVEWGGVADTITKDVVNDWTSGTFTPGNFFKSTTTTIVATGSVALTANTLASIALSGTVSGSMNNLAVFFWTDSTQAQNVTLDVGKVDLRRSLVSSAFEARSYQEELALCMRYFQKFGAFVGSSGWLAGSGYQQAGGGSFISYLFGVPMRVGPVGTKNGTWNVVNCGQPSIQYTHPFGFTLVAITTATGAWVFTVDSADDWLTFDARL
jgi:hypothetical protein